MPDLLPVVACVSSLVLSVLALVACRRANRATLEVTAGPCAVCLDVIAPPSDAVMRPCCRACAVAGDVTVSCPDCGAPVRPDDPEAGECRLCSSRLHAWCRSSHARSCR